MRCARPASLRLGLAFGSALLLACTAEPQRSDKPPSDEPVNCYDCNELPVLPANPEETLAALPRRCGLTLENISGEGHELFIPVTDKNAGEKLRCLAEDGDHEIVGEYAYALITADRHLRPPNAEQLAYRYSMTALKNYLLGLDIRLEDDDFIEKYRKLGEQPGLINLSGPSDRLYYYSGVQRQLIRDGSVQPTEAERKKLEQIDKLDPGY